MDFATQREEVPTNVPFEKGTNTHINGHGCTHAHQQGAVVGWPQGCIASWRFLLPEHTQGVLLVATGLTRVRDGRDV